MQKEVLAKTQKKVLENTQEEELENTQEEVLEKTQKYVLVKTFGRGRGGGAREYLYLLEKTCKRVKGGSKQNHGDWCTLGELGKIYRGGERGSKREN